MQKALAGAEALKAKAAARAAAYRVLIGTSPLRIFAPGGFCLGRLWPV